MIEQIKQQFPLVYGRLKQFCEEQLEKIPEDQKRLLNIDLDTVIKSYFVAPRVLIEFFDSQNVHVDTSYLDDEGYDFEIRSERIYDKPFLTRELAEKAGVEQAFKVLEKQLENDNT